MTRPWLRPNDKGIYTCEVSEIENEINAGMEPREEKRSGLMTDAGRRVRAVLFCVAVGVGFWVFVFSILPIVGLIAGLVLMTGLVVVGLSEAWRRVKL
jgi:hypothetical protein